MGELDGVLDDDVDGVEDAARAGVSAMARREDVTSNGPFFWRLALRPGAAAEDERVGRGKTCERVNVCDRSVFVTRTLHDLHRAFADRMRRVRYRA